MTFRDIYKVANTDSPKIKLYDENGDLIYEKAPNEMIVRMEYWDYEIAHIFSCDYQSIMLQVRKPTI